MSNPFDKRSGKRMKNERSKLSGSYELDKLFEKFVKAKTAEGLSEKTIESYHNNYTFFKVYLVNKKVIMDVRNIDTDLIRDYIYWMMKEKVRFEGNKFKSDGEKTKGLSPTTINMRLKTLRTMFRFLETEGYIDNNPFTHIKNVEEPDNEISVLTVEQLQKLLSAPNKRSYAGFRDYVLMNVLIDGFFRISEALELKRQYINWDVGLINIPAEISKGKKSRSVPLQKHTLKLIKDLIEEVDDFDTDYIFVANYGDKLTPNHFRHRLSKYVEEAKLDCRVHPHLFRHTAATLALEAGMDIRHLQMILGHRDLRMVLRYTHLSKTSLMNQHNQYSPMNQVLGKLSKPRKIKR